MARETRDVAHDLGYAAIFVACDDSERKRFAGPGHVILETEIDQYASLPFVIGIGDGALRRKIFTRYFGAINFINLIHPSVTFGYQQREEIEKKRGVIVCAGARFTSRIYIGNFTIFNVNATVSHDCVVDEYTTVCPQACVLGNVEIQSGAWIGAGAVINQGNNQTRRIIGKNTVIGSGAVVLNDCASNAVYVGVPARRIK